MRSMIASLAAPLAEETGRAVAVSWRLYLAVVKVMVPTMVAVEAAKAVGAVDVLGALFAPVMGLVGLPPEMGLVWAATALLGLYPGFGAFAALLSETQLTVAQATVLGSMALFAHGLPVEQRICRRAGVGATFSTALRLGGALAYGAILNLVFSGLDLYQEPAVLLLPTPAPGGGVAGWLVDTAVALAWMFAVIVAIVAAMRVLEAIGAMRLLRAALAPVLRLMGMGPTAAPLTVIGMLLGITYGGGLIIKETEAGTLSRRDVFLSVAFMCLCHSVVEDTLFLLAIGGDLTALLVGRFVFSVLVVALIARVLARVPERTFERYLMAPSPAA
jgi:spore maturation protein SpmB